MMSLGWTTYTYTNAQLEHDAFICRFINLHTERSHQPKETAIRSLLLLAACGEPTEAAIQLKEIIFIRQFNPATADNNSKCYVHVWAGDIFVNWMWRDVTRMTHLNRIFMYNWMSSVAVILSISSETLLFLYVRPAASSERGRQVDT